AKRVIVIVNQYASRLVDGSDPQYDPAHARAHLQSIFGTEGTWVPISRWVKRLMYADRRYPSPYAIPWHPMIDVAAWCSDPIRWRGADRYAPVVGRHGRDSYTKWPSTPEALAHAYGVGQEWDVRFLGGADHAIDMLGYQPVNWSVVPFDEMSALEFLCDLDFYVHFPHEGYIEEFGRGVMEAMALGIPVILPPQFRETFGDVATYTSANAVPEVVCNLWSSRERYLERAQAARGFVLRSCDRAAFGRRLEALINETTSHGGTPEHSAPGPSAAAER